MAESETKAEAEVRTEKPRFDEDDDERVVNLKIDLRGPMELLYWANPFNARRRFMEMLPQGAREHMANAQKEQLLAVRSIVDSVLDSMIDRMERPHEKPERRATKVEVE